MERRKRDREKEKACGTKEDGWKKRKGLAGKTKMDRVIVYWREKERKCKKDVTQYVGYRGTRACERSFLLVALARSLAEFPA